MEDLVGTYVDDWKLTGKIAEGAMGAVYNAERGGQRAAVKVALPETLSVDHLQRFRREAHMLMEIRDPNVVRCYHAGEGDRFVYLALEFLPGGSLQDLLDERGRLTVSQVVGVARRVLLGLAAVHERGILHRDIKPANVLLTREGLPKLADFGLAKGHDNARITSTGEVLGTVDYMSPEQFASVRGIDERADLYSVGAMLYHLVTGQPPYSGRSSLAVLEQHKVAPIPNPTKCVRSAKKLVKPIAVLMAKDPDERPKSALAALALFEGLKEATLIEGQKLVDSGAHKRKKHSQILDLLLLIGLITCAVGTYDITQRQGDLNTLGLGAVPAPVGTLLEPHFVTIVGVVGFLLIDRILARTGGAGILGRLGRLVGIGRE